MRPLILKMSISLDGFVAGPNGELDWLFRTSDEGGRRWVEEMLWQAGLHAMGSRTYADMASFWPTSDMPMAAPMNEIPKVVFTRQKSLDLGAGRTTAALRDAQSAEPAAAAPAHAANLKSWTEAEVASGDLVTEMTRLKQQPGKFILAHGGAQFAQSLVASGLIDEYRLVVHPVILGKGLPLFSQLPKPLDLELQAITVFRSGTAAHIYRPVR
ncbi:dihydrofolate reductase family protein [Dyella sp. EPa41]|uniref:dihydrofolate reductase family protein n=1 Tax=Dyella sp. EPa41 TaxID=1561194 RepID=UPI0019160076|nr:dihydrofolate reductase family protein [Dyella sp. EPa41]